jgi:hypothetical protein
MTSIIKAISEYRPRIILARTLTTEDVARLIEGRTALNEGEILNVLYELNNVARDSTLNGQSVSIHKLGIIRPSLRLDGRFRVHVRIDPSIRKAINVPAAFKGTVVNRENIGKSRADLVEMWNLEHPDDPVEMP